MDRIKKIKIKQQDGTMSDYYPIGVDANNVDIDYNNSTLEVTMKKTPRYYENVASMKLDDTLQEGDMAITLGYYEANDGGGAEYKIINGNYTDDGGSYHELTNGLWAELIIKDYITPEQFGAYGDNIHDDTGIFSNIINYLPNKGTIKGNLKHNYKISNLIIQNVFIEDCNFRGANNETDGIGIKSGCRIHNCTFYNFRNAIYMAGICVHTFVVDSTFAYNRKGMVLFDENNTSWSLNDFIVDKCYFVKNGRTVDDMSAAETPETGYGIEVDYHADQLIITNTVFEYNSFTGIYIKNSTTASRQGIQVYNNYFEGNRNSAILLSGQYNVSHMIGINNNYFSSISTNVKGTQYINYDHSQTSLHSSYKIADVCPITMSINSSSAPNAVIDNKNHTVTIQGGTDAQYFSYSYMTDRGMKPLKLYVQAVLNHNINLQISSGEDKQVITLTNGKQSFEITSVNYYAWYLQRKLVEGESLTFYTEI